MEMKYRGCFIITVLHQAAKIENMWNCVEANLIDIKFFLASTI